MQVTADGQLRHCFFGNYSAIIALGFETSKHAQDALLSLNKHEPGWSIGTKSAKALIWSGDSEALSRMKEILGKFGADKEKIDSIKYSVDYGEKFQVTIPVIPQEQSSLF